MYQAGYAIIDSGNAVVRSFSGLPRIIVWPNGDESEPVSVGMAHVTYDEAGNITATNYKLVELWYDDAGVESWTQKLDTGTASFDGTKVTITRALIDRTSDELTANLADRKVSMGQQVDVKLESVLTSGFIVPSEVSTALAGKVLQTRNLDDRTNWLTSQAAYSAAIAGGGGAAMEAQFRAADNSTTTVSYTEGLNILLTMAAWGKTAYTHSWSLKDSISAATDHATLDVIDINAGW